MIDLNDIPLLVHVVIGTLAVMAGAVALAVRKGARSHIWAGRIFAVTMGWASAIGAVLGIVEFTDFYITFHAGILGVTLILSGWMTARARSGRLGSVSVGVGVLNALNTAGLVAASAYAASTSESTLFGFHASDYLFLGLMTAVALIGDVSLIFRKALSEKHRIARHLWRMGLGFFIAAGSAFTGPGAVVFSEAVRNSGLLALPELIIIILVVFWLLRTLLAKPKAYARNQD